VLALGSSGWGAQPAFACPGRPLRAERSSRGISVRRAAILASQYEFDAASSKTVKPFRKPRPPVNEESADAAIFNKDRVWEYAWGRPFEVVQRTVFLASIVAGIWSAWQKPQVDESGSGQSTAYMATTFKQTRPESERGKALRTGLAQMGVFFVKMGQTLAQRPDIVGDELAEELKGLQERSVPFDDQVALQIIAEDLQHRGPLAPGVWVAGCDIQARPLLAELNPVNVASASIGQVYKGRLWDGREVALKVQRPGAQDVLGLDWAVAVFGVMAYQQLKNNINDYNLIVDTVAKGIKMELDYHEEAANCLEFATRHAFLPFVSSPAWVPEFTGPEGSARVLCLEWYPSRAPSELPRHERRRLVEMAVEACVVQLLVTGFVHADPHEGNLRMGDDGRVVFLDFGLMDRIDFGVMESFAAGIRSVLNSDWPALVQSMQDAKFTPTPLMKFVRDPVSGAKSLQECDAAEFAEVVARKLTSDQAGTSRFGAMAMALKDLSNEYAMLTPPYVALLARTFITLEGMLADDPQMAAEFNIYENALPFAVSRILSPRTRKGQAALRNTLLIKGSPNWAALASFLQAEVDNEAAPGIAAAASDLGDGESSSRSITSNNNNNTTNNNSGSNNNNNDDLADRSSSSSIITSRSRGNDHAGDSYGAREAVQMRLLATSEGAALRRVFFDMDLFQALNGFLHARESRPFRQLFVQELAGRWAGSDDERAPTNEVPWGPRSAAAAREWGSTDVSSGELRRRARKAWRVVFRRQLRSLLSPRRFLGVLLLVPSAARLLIRTALRASQLRRSKTSLRR
ncbi:unnamed protein product, partial [Polarella glacialis]